MKTNHILLLISVFFYAQMLNGAVKIDNFQKDGCPLIIPEVKKMTAVKSDFSLSGSFTVAASKDSKTEFGILKKAVARRFPGVKVTEGDFKSADCRLVITKNNVPKSEQGYALKIDKEGIIISARSRSGLFYGVQTLASIIRNSKSRTLKGCLIKDWPSLKIRGVFFNLRNLKSQDIDKFKKTIDALAALKYNMLLLEFADNFPFKGNPFSKRKFTLKKADIKEISEYARQNHFMLIPSVQMLSHTRWLNTHPDFKSMVEGKPSRSWCYSYCPSNPKVNKLMLKVVTETIELLKPDYIHLNFDEIALCPWRVCPKCKARDSVELLEEHVKMFEAKVFELGSKPMFYHDSFYPGHPRVGGEKVLEKLDRRDAIAFWEYSVQPRESRFRYFSERGFTTLGVTYCRNLENNPAMARIAVKNGGAGCYLTYWSYMRIFLENKKKTHHRAYAATLLGANYFWSPYGAPLDKLTYDPVFEMRRLLDENIRIQASGAKARPVPVVKQVNVELGSDPEFPVFSNDKELNEIKDILAASPEKFKLITAPDGKYYGIMLAGSKDSSSPASVTIPIGIKADRISFLLTTSRLEDFNKYRDRYHWRQAHAGDIKFNFDDGSSCKMALKYRYNIIDWNTDCGAYATRLILRAADDEGSSCMFFATDFYNPEPEKLIKSITFSTERNEGLSPVLFAISAFGGKSGDLKNVEDEFSAIPKNILIRKKINYKDKIYVDFENGMQTAKFFSSGRFSKKTEAVIVTSNKNKVLKITVPPMKLLQRRVRVFLDLPIAVTPENKAIRFDYKIDSPEKIDSSRAYIGIPAAGKFNFDYNFHRPGNKGWNTIRIPFKTMVKEKGGCNPRDAKLIRISFWLYNLKETENIYLDNIGTCDVEVPRRPSLIKVYNNK